MPTYRMTLKARTEDRALQWALTGALALILLAMQCPAAANQGKRVSGYVETVRIRPGELSLNARIDTGAEHSSLNAKSVEGFTRDGKPWVRFSLTDSADRSSIIEGAVQRIARVRRHGGGIQERPVILLGICLGAVFKTVEVNLADRSGFDYQMLVGRSFLGADFLVDPSQRFLLQPQCR